MKHQYATTRRLLVIALACLSGCALAALGQAPSGSLVGSVAGPIANGTVVDLTAEGPVDWAAWGRTSGTSFDHKATGGAQISDLTQIDPFGFLIQNMPTGISLSWSDGTPEANVVGNTNNVRIELEGNGFRFTVPADRTLRRLKVYVGARHGNGQLTAQLLDGSAAAYMDATPRDSTGPPEEVMYVYTLDYQAASAGQVLTVEYVALSVTVGGAGGHISISAATLSRLPIFDDTKTQVALPLAAPPQIDGVINPAEWGRASTWSVTVDTNLTDGFRGGASGDIGGGNLPTDNTNLSYQVYVGYDTNNLYIAVRVSDSAIWVDNAEAESANTMTWMDDSVEVFIDGDNSNFGSRDTSGTNPEVVGTGGQFVITANNAHRDAEAGMPSFGPTAVWFARTTTNATGYDAEFRISLQKIGNPRPGDIIGFTVAVNDDDDGAGGERQVLWVGSPHTEATYGNLVIGGRSYSAPKTNAPTIDGVIGTNEYAGAVETKVSNFSSIYDLGAGDDTWPATDHGYSAWVVHDADAVYVAIDVTDDMVVNDSAAAGSEDGMTGEDDSVEIFFDADHSHNTGGGAGQFEGQYVFTANGARRDNGANNPTFGASADWFAATSRTAGGYQVEFKIKKSALFNPQDGATLGFNIAVNDDDGSGRKAQLAWSGRALSEFTYGHLTLSGGGAPPRPQIESIRQSGVNLEISFTSPNPAGVHVIRQTANLTAPVVWAPTPGVTFSGAPNNPLTAAFPKPAGSATFYQVGQQP